MKKILLALLGLMSISASAQKNIIIKSGELSLRSDMRVTMEGAAYLPAQSLKGWKWLGQDDFRFAQGANITQARFGMWANLGEKWQGKIDFRIINRQVLLQDVFLDYRIKPQSLYLRAGYYADPVSAEANAASTLLSLNTPEAVSFLAHQTRFLGLSLTSFGKHHYLVGGVYGTNLAPDQMQVNRGRDAWSVALKGVYLPINEARKTLYLGAYARYRQLAYRSDRDYGTMSYMASPGSTIDGRSFLGATFDYVKGYSLWGAELAATMGRWHFIGEYIGNKLYFHRDNLYGRKSLNLHGGYLTASYMFWGRQRKYLDYWGMFSPLANLSTEGALELIGRVSYVHANNKAKTEEQADINLGKSAVLTLGLNWYPYGGNILLGVNYNYNMYDKYARSGGLLVAPETAIDRGFSFHTLQCRLQFIF